MGSLTELREKRTKILTATEAVLTAAKDAGRDLTDDETATIERAHNAVRDIDKQIKGSQLVSDVLALGCSCDPESGCTCGRSGGGGDGRVLALGKAFTNQIAAKMRTQSQQTSGKALVTPAGTAVVDVPTDPAPIPLGQPANTLLDAIPMTGRAPTYRYLRQTTRTMNAAPVARNAVKPTSLMGVEPVDARLRVVAHLSEPVDRYDLRDNASLQAFVGAELTAGLRAAIEAQCIGGDGLGENFLGFANASGINAVTAGPDRITSLRKGLTAIEAFGVPPMAYVVAPVDWEAIESTRTAQGNFDVGGPVDAATRKAWGVQVIVSHAATTGTAHLLGEGAVNLSTDGAIAVEWTGDAADLFSKNQLLARCEVRANLDVLRPFAVAEIDLVAP
jgi:HK97 family phage major capsid protein